MLCHPFALGGPQRQARRAKSEMVASPLPRREAQKRAEKLHHPCISTNAKRGEQKQKCLWHSRLLGSPKEGRNATSPLRPWGSPTPSAGSKIRSGYLTPAFSWGKNRAEMLRLLCILGGPQRQARGAKLDMVASPLPCQEAKKRAEMLHHPCIVGVPKRQARGAKSEVAISPLTSQGAKRGPKCPATPASSGVPNAKRREQNQKWLSDPCLLGGPQRQAWGAKSEMVVSLLTSWLPKRGRK